MNVKGPIRLERLEANIDEYIKASRGLCTSSHSLHEILPGSIGTIDKEQSMATIVSGEEEYAVDARYDNGGSSSVDDKLGKHTFSPIPLSAIINEDKAKFFHNRGIAPRRRLVRRRSSASLGPLLDEGESSDFCTGNEEFMNSIDVSGIIKSRTSGVKIYKAQLRSDGSTKYAVKVARCLTENDIDMLHDLKQEGYVASRLDHPNICKLLDMIVTPE